MPMKVGRTGEYRPQSSDSPFARAASSSISGARLRAPPRRLRIPAYSSRTLAVYATRLPGSSSLPATAAQREASSTCTVAPEYRSSIFTAVWIRDVVAPPIRRGTSIPVRSISEAT